MQCFLAVTFILVINLKKTYLKQLLLIMSAYLHRLFQINPLSPLLQGQ